MRLITVALLALTGCVSPQTQAVTDTAIPCTCGQPGTDWDGCAHSDCIVGVRNADNPDCVCGPLGFSAEGGAQ
jgi:hypothetical protein